MTNAIATTQTQIATAVQMTLLEAPVAITLVAGSIKGAMKAVNGGGEKTASSRDLWQVNPFELLVIEGLNPRVMTPAYEAHIRDLADSMKANKFYQDKPLAGYVAKKDGKDVIYIYDGGTRLLAAKLAISEGAEITHVPVSVDQAGMSMEDVMVAMMRANTGKPLTMYEKAVMIQRLVWNKWDAAKINDRLGSEYTPVMIDNMMALMAAPIEIRTKVAEDTMSMTLALELIKKHGDKVVEKAEQIEANAKAAGKTRITARFVEGAKFQKAAKKAAEPMFQTLQAVQNDPAFASLSEEVRTQLLALVGQLEEAKKETPAVDTAEKSAPALTLVPAATTDAAEELKVA